MPEKKRPAHDTSAAARLRHAIDSGNTGDKVNYPDPAAAPLGTDDEAAGTPPALTQRDIDAETGPVQREQRHWIPSALGETSARLVTVGFGLVVVLVIGWLLSRANG
jgi:hypothetical protein